MPVTVDELLVGDDPEVWRSVGFTVDDDGVCRLGTVRVRLTGSSGRRHLYGWSLRGLPGPIGDLDGVITVPSTNDPCDPAEHTNGSIKIDHVVLTTPDVERTVAVLDAIGLEPRRVRDDAERYPEPARQVFFRLGEVILELIGPQTSLEGSADVQARLWGLAVDSTDLDALAEHLGPDRVTEPKTAVQPGRRIATLKTRALDISTAVAFMSVAGASR